MQQLKSKLQQLVDQHSIILLKTGTEVEDMNFHEIQYLREITSNITLLSVKIGGSEARNDIRFCLQNSIDIIIAPMIESKYALSNFLKTIELLKKEISPSKKVQLGFNLETITSYLFLKEILQKELLKQIHQITIGKGDFEASLTTTEHEKNKEQYIKEILHYIHQTFPHILTSIGGGLQTSSFLKQVQTFFPQRWNTRHVCFQTNSKEPLKNIEALQESLEFEILLHQKMIQEFPEHTKKYQARIYTLQNRL